MKPFVVTVDGKDYDVDAPDERTAWQWANQAHSRFKSSVSSKMTPAFEMEARNPASGYNAGEQLFAGVGKGMTDVGRGIGQMMGVGPTRQEMDEIKNRDKSLTSSGFGGAGNVLGGMAAATPAMLVPGANTVLGGAAIGGALGASQPVGTQDSRLANTAIGAGIGGAVPAAIKGTIAVGGVARNLLDPLMPGGTGRAVGRVANKAADSDQQAIVQALRNSQGVTAGEAAVSVGRPEFNALQEAVKGRMPAEYDRLAQAQNKARIAALRGVGKDKAALEAAQKLRSDNAAENYGPIMGNLIDPRAESQIMKDAIANRAASKAEALRDWGRFGTTEAQMNVRGENFFPVPGQPRVPSRVSNFPERAAEANLAAKDAIGIARQRLGEEKFLDNTLDLLKQTVGVDDVALSSFLSRPSVKAALKEAADSAAEKGIYFPTNPGDKFSIANLQRVKEALGDMVSTPQISGLKASQQKEVTDTVSAFTKWLSNRSPEWKNARLQYAEDSIPINQMKIGQYLEGKLVPALSDQGMEGGQRASMFAQVLRDAPGTIKKATGQPRYDELGQIMNPLQEDALRGVGRSLGQQAEHQRLGRVGMERAKELLAPAELPPTGMFSPIISTARSIANRASGRLSEAQEKRLAEAMLNPQDLATLMQNATPQQTKMLANILRSSQMPITGGALAPLGE